MKLSKQRLEALSDGIIAIIITIMVLSIPLPPAFDRSSLLQLAETLIIYFISFIVVGSFWSQHSRIFYYINNISGKVTWVNLLFLFFLSLIPIFTKWVMENPSNIIPAVGYNVVYLFVNLSYLLIFEYIICNSEHEGIKKVRESRTDSRKRNSVFRFFITLIIIITAIVVSVYVPKIPGTFLLIFPVLSSALNLLLEDYRRELKKNIIRQKLSDI